MLHHNSLKMSAKKNLTKDVMIVNQRGLHARAAAKLAKCANSFNCTITITHNTTTACAKDILDLLTLAASQGALVTIKTSRGSDAPIALQTIATLIESGFEEDQGICPIQNGV